MSAYQPKTGARCGCRRGVQRDNCPNCEGTGWVINFAAIRFAVRLNMADKAKKRLEYLRGEIRAERISYGELAELQSLVPHIEPGDVELLEAAGVPEKGAE
jgi:hypothetical protein